MSNSTNHQPETLASTKIGRVHIAALMLAVAVVATLLTPTVGGPPTLSAAAPEASHQYEVVLQDDEYLYVLDNEANTKTWAGHCTDQLTSSRAVTWDDLKNVPETETPSCDVLIDQVGSGATVAAVAADTPAELAPVAPQTTVAPAPVPLDTAHVENVAAIQAATTGQYEVVLQDGEFLFVIDAEANTKTWASHCAADLGSGRAVTWDDVKDLHETETPSCDVLVGQVGAGATVAADAPAEPAPVAPQTPAEASPQAATPDEAPAPTPEVDTTQPESNEPVGLLIEGAEGTITLQSLREVRDSGLPEVIKEDFLEDVAFSQMSDAELDAQFDEAVVVNTAEAVDIAQRVAEEATTKAEPGQPDRRIKGFCSKWDADHKDFSFSVDADELRESFSESNSKDFGNGFSFDAFADGDFSGELDVVIEFHYEIKRNKWICLPYGARFNYADITVTASADGNIDAEATLSYENVQRLWETTLDLWSGRFDFNVEFLRGQVTADLDLDLALDLQTKASLTARVDESFHLDADVHSALHCESDGCEQLDGSRTDVEISHDSQSGLQATIDVELTPSAELRFGMALYLGDPFFIVKEEVAAASIGVVAEFPARLFFTAGNLCSDADGDGSNENVRLALVDINARVSAYWSADVLGKDKAEWFSSIGLSGWERIDNWQPVHAFGSGPAGPRTVFTKNLYFKVLDQGDSSPLQPVISAAGVFDDGDREGIVISGARECYPLGGTPEYEIDWSRSPGATSRYEGAGYVAHDWANDGAGDAVSVRMVGDSTGRSFTGPWVNVELTGGVAENGTPYCVSATDPDGDGWGWEDGQSCRVASVVGNPDDVPGDIVCSSIDSDPDGDGWGWEDGQSCRVNSSAEKFALIIEQLTRWFR